MFFERLFFNLNKNKHKLYTLLALILTFVGCQTEDINNSAINGKSVTEENLDIAQLNNKNYIATASLEERQGYKEFHLFSLMEQVPEVNTDFEELDEFKSAKDKEPSFYLENLLLSTLVQAKVYASVSTDDIKSHDAFTDLEGETWYPIVKRLKNGNGKKAIYLMNSYDESKDQEVVKAFKLNKNGKLKLIERNVSEEMFDSDFLSGKASSSYYQLALSQCALGGTIQKALTDCSGGTGGGGTSYYSNKIKAMTIKDKKESWIEKADVHYIAETWSDVTLTSGVYYARCRPMQYPYCDADGNLIRKYSQKEVKNKTSITVNYPVNYSSNNQSLVQYTIFEYDSFPAQIRTYEETVNRAKLNIKFRSYQTAYDTRTVTYTGSYGLQSGSGVSVNNSSIEYNIN